MPLKFSILSLGMRTTTAEAPKLTEEYNLVSTSMSSQIDGSRQLWTNGLPIYTGRHVEFHKCTSTPSCPRGMLNFSIVHS